MNQCSRNDHQTLVIFTNDTSKELETAVGVEVFSFTGEVEDTKPNVLQCQYAVMFCIVCSRFRTRII